MLADHTGTGLLPYLYTVVISVRHVMVRTMATASEVARRRRTASRRWGGEGQIPEDEVIAVIRRVMSGRNADPICAFVPFYLLPSLRHPKCYHHEKASSAVVDKPDSLCLRLLALLGVRDSLLALSLAELGTTSFILPMGM